MIQPLLHFPPSGRLNGLLFLILLVSGDLIQNILLFLCQRFELGVQLQVVHILQDLLQQKRLFCRKGIQPLSQLRETRTAALATALGQLRQFQNIGFDLGPNGTVLVQGGGYGFM